MPLAEGQLFGNYRILSRLGAGGMGMVYLAEHPLIGKKVALKVIHKELSGNKEIVTRFFNEARAVNTIGNEHIVQIHDLGQSPEGHYFFIMEYLDGQTLAKVLEREVMVDVRRALHVAAQIADALGAAHACGIIHRDLKPDNIMLIERYGDPDFVKVLDFGLAKMYADANVNLTAQGVVLGTPQYMSPEACECKKIDQRTDVYSLGVLLFQMMTGQLPFDGTTMGEILVKQVLHLPPAPRGVNPYIPPAVEQIILRCLAKQADARFGSMHELRVALLDPDRYLGSSPPVMPSAAVPPDAQARTILMAPRPDPGELGNAPALPMVPVMPENRTMRIATPHGYKTSKRWPLLLALAVVTAVISAVTAIVLLDGRGSPVKTASATPEPRPTDELARKPQDMPRDMMNSAAGEQANVTGGQAAAEKQAQEAAASGTTDRSSQDSGTRDSGVQDESAGNDAEHEPVGSEPGPVLVAIELSTEPSGAEVFDVDEVLLGTTPTTVRLPRDGKEHVLVFRHPKARERKKSVIATRDRQLQIELELLDKPKPRGQNRDPDRKVKRTTESKDKLLMQPDF